MPKTGTQRSDKYTAKYDPTVVSARYTATKDAAVASVVSHSAALALLALAVRGYLNGAGILPINSVRFIGFGNKLYGMTQKIGGAAATAQAELMAKAWVDQIDATAGDKIVLTEIWNYFSSVIGVCPSPFPSN